MKVSLHRRTQEGTELGALRNLRTQLGLQDDDVWRNDTNPCDWEGVVCAHELAPFFEDTPKKWPCQCKRNQEWHLNFYTTLRQLSFDLSSSVVGIILNPEVLTSNTTRGQGIEQIFVETLCNFVPLCGGYKGIRQDMITNFYYQFFPTSLQRNLGNVTPEWFSGPDGSTCGLKQRELASADLSEFAMLLMLAIDGLHVDALPSKLLRSQPIVPSELADRPALNLPPGIQYTFGYDGSIAPQSLSPDVLSRSNAAQPPSQEYEFRYFVGDYGKDALTYYAKALDQVLSWKIGLDKGYYFNYDYIDSQRTPQRQLVSSKAIGAILGTYIFSVQSACMTTDVRPVLADLGAQVRAACDAQMKAVTFKGFEGLDLQPDYTTLPTLGSLYTSKSGYFDAACGCRLYIMLDDNELHGAVASAVDELYVGMQRSATNLTVDQRLYLLDFDRQPWLHLSLTSNPELEWEATRGMCRRGALRSIRKVYEKSRVSLQSYEFRHQTARKGSQPLPDLPTLSDMGLDNFQFSAYEVYVQQTDVEFYSRLEQCPTEGLQCCLEPIAWGTLLTPWIVWLLFVVLGCLLIEVIHQRLAARALSQVVVPSHQRESKLRRLLAKPRVARVVGVMQKVAQRIFTRRLLDSIDSWLWVADMVTDILFFVSITKAGWNTPNEATLFYRTADDQARVMRKAQAVTWTFMALLLGGQLVGSVVVMQVQLHRKLVDHPDVSTLRRFEHMVATLHSFKYMEPMRRGFLRRLAFVIVNCFCRLVLLVPFGAFLYCVAFANQNPDLLMLWVDELFTPLLVCITVLALAFPACMALLTNELAQVLNSFLFATPWHLDPLPWLFPITQHQDARNAVERLVESLPQALLLTVLAGTNHFHADDPARLAPSNYVPTILTSLLSLLKLLLTLYWRASRHDSRPSGLWIEFWAMLGYKGRSHARGHLAMLQVGDIPEAAGEMGSAPLHVREPVVIEMEMYGEESRGVWGGGVTPSPWSGLGDTGRQLSDS